MGKMHCTIYIKKYEIPIDIEEFEHILSNICGQVSMDPNFL